MKVYLKTFGCRANQYDSETVRAMVERSGGAIVAQPEDADVAVFNSCAVTAEAEVDLRKSIRRAARRRPELTTLVMGCAAALDRGVLSSLPTVRQPTRWPPGAASWRRTPRSARWCWNAPTCRPTARPWPRVSGCRSTIWSPCWAPG
jgi:tRNA A37 methylthiotransferase MiaB